jgi:DNA-binding SARP family transcriptional activator
MDLRVRVLGGFEIEGIDSHRLGSRKARTLLKVLAVARGRPVSVDRLIDVLWPQTPPTRPEDQVFVLVSRLRAVLGGERLSRTDAGYSLRAGWLDLEALADLEAAAGRRLAIGSYRTARASAEAALALARGPVLAGEPDAIWAEAERAAAERLVTSVRHTAARAALGAADYTAAAGFAAGALDADPYDEVALRLLMRAHARAGRPASALAAYAQVKQRLDDDLGVDPAPETESLYLSILRQDPLPAEPADAQPDALPAGRRFSPPANAGRRRGSAATPGLFTAQPLLPGRAEALAALDAALERAAGDQVELVVVEGEAGIGKSRLLEVWAAGAGAGGAALLRGRGSELARNLPLQPILDAIEGCLLGLPSSDAALAVLGPERAVLAPLLPSIQPAAQPVAVDPASGQAVLFSALLAVIARIAARAPTALLLDDLHLADRATIEWLHFAAGHGVGLRLLVIGALRPDEAPPFLPDAQRLVLGPLDLAAVELVVGRDRAGDLHVRSGGHPLFLVELAAAEPGELPESLREAVVARCNRAGPQVAATLRTAALLGPAIDLDLLAGVLQQAPLETLGHLEEGMRRRLLAEEGAGFAFRHDLIREALAASVWALRRALVHREAARVLAARSEAEPLAIANHARLGGDPELAATALAAAAARAAERYDHAESGRLLDLAVELADAPSHRLQRARTRLFLGDYHDAEEDALVALRKGPDARALELAGWAAYYRRDFAAARQYADDGAGLAGGADRARCLTLGGRARGSDGDLLGAAACLEEALALAPDPHTRAAPAAFLSQVRCWQGHAEEALDLARVAVRAGSAADIQSLALYAHMTKAHALAVLGRPAEALQAVDVWEAEIERQHVTRFQGRPHNFRAWVLRGLGHVAEAADLNQQALAEARAVGGAETEAHALLDLATGELLAGDVGGAAAYLDALRPLEQGTHANRWRYALRYQLLCARAALAGGRPAAARALAAEVRTRAGSLGVERYVDLAFLLEVQARAALGESGDSAAIGRVLAALPRHAGLEAWWLAAEVAAATGVAAFWSMAEAHAARLAVQAGDHAGAFRRYAGARLETMRTAGSHG